MAHYGRGFARGAKKEARHYLEDFQRPPCPLFFSTLGEECKKADADCPYSHWSRPRMPPKLEQERMGPQKFADRYGEHIRPYKWANGRAVMPIDDDYEDVVCEAWKEYRIHGQRKEEEEKRRQMAPFEEHGEHAMYTMGEHMQWEKQDQEEGKWEDDGKPVWTAADYYDPTQTNLFFAQTKQEWQDKRNRLHFPGIRKIVLGGEHYVIDNEELAYLKRLPLQCSRLKALVIGDFLKPIRMDLNLLMEVISTSPFLTCLILDGALEVTADHVCVIFKLLPGLEVLRISGCLDVRGHTSIHQVLRYLGRHPKIAPRLQVLALVNMFEEAQANDCSALTHKRKELTLHVGASPKDEGQLWKVGYPQSVDIWRNIEEEIAEDWIAPSYHHRMLANDPSRIY